MTCTTISRKVLNLFGIFILITLMTCFAPGCGGGGGDAPPDPPIEDPSDNDPDPPDPAENTKPVAAAGPDQTIVIESDVDLDGRQSSDADSDPLTYKWSLEKPAGSSVMISDDTAANFTFTPDVVGIYVFQLVVNDSTENSDPDPVTITVEDLASIGEADQGVIEDLLYTAYAGIGYNTVLFGDDEFLYRLMFNDLNLIAVDLTLETLYSDPNMIVKLLEFVGGLGNPLVTFESTFDGGTSKISVQRGDKVSLPGGGLFDQVTEFSGTVAVDIGTAGYEPNIIGISDTTLYGEAGKFDIEGTVDGYFKATLTGVDKFFLRSVSITAKESLSVTYGEGEDAKDVIYDEWSMAYTLKYGDQDPNYGDSGYTDDPLNTVIVPLMLGIAPDNFDNRNYLLNGGFSVNEQAYEFLNVRYRQTDSGIGNAGIKLSGRIKIPGLNGFVEVKENDTDFVIRNAAGLWTDGEITITGEDTAYDVAFSTKDGDLSIPVADISDNDLIDFSVEDWQNFLDPYAP